MGENKIEKSQSGFIHQVLHVVKRNLWLILAVIIAVTVCGAGYSVVRKPKYTANMRVSFSVEGKDSATIGENIQYINTIVDFVDEGVVIDRANAYYIKWVDGYKKAGKTVQEFCADFKEINTSGVVNTLYRDYDRVATLSADKFIHASSISTKTKQNEETTNWIFQICCSDGNSQDALEKAYILVLAYEHELEGGEYFGENSSLKINIGNLGFDGVSVDISKKTIIIIAFVLGAVLAVLLVYVKNLFDNTIKDKEELEIITGVELVGCIDLVEEGRNGK